jgi:hypothetical protein
MRRFPKKELFLVISGAPKGKKTKVIFTRKLRAYRYAAQMRTFFLTSGQEGKMVETKTITSEEMLKLQLKTEKAK